MNMKTLTRNDLYALIDRVQLADGQIVEVPRANLAAAKALLAAQRAAERRVAAQVERERVAREAESQRTMVA